jgi:hypothetical protein
MGRYDKYGANDDRKLQEIDLGFTGFNNRLRPDQLKASLLEKCENARLDRNGEWKVRLGTNVVLAPLAVGDTALTLPFDVFDNFTVAQADFSRSGTEITFTKSSHGLSTGTVITLSGLGTAGVDPDGDRRITKVDDNNFKIAVTGLTGKPSGDATFACAPMNDSAVNVVYGSCSFSDPNSANNDSYIILAGNTKAVAVNIEDPSTNYNLNYPLLETVSSSVQVIQAFNKVIIFRKGAVALEVDLAANNITGSPSFSLVANGAFTQPITKTATVFAISNGVASVTASGHNFEVNDAIRLSIAGDSGLVLNSNFTVASVADANNFTFIADEAADIADGDVSTYPKFIARQSSETGFIHMPTPEFGELHQGRLLVPYQFDQTGSSGSPTITSRKIFDEVIASDLLDSDTYDPFFASLRFNAGASDFTVAIKSFTEDSVLVFNKNSIHRVVGTTNIGSASSQILTDEIGCLARDSVVQVGKNIFFLSDNGVYSLEFFDEFNLRGTQTPLSESIQNTIFRINQGLAKNSVARYFDNRYYIAVPLNGEDGTEASYNNALLVYNFLTQEWESIDSINSSPQFEYKNLLVAGLGKNRGLFCVNSDGGIHQIAGDESVFPPVTKQGLDNVVTQIGASQSEISIKGVLKSRMYTFGDLGRKKYSNFDVQAEGGDVVSDFSLKVQTENIDIELDNSTALLGSASDFLGKKIPINEDVAIRGRIGNLRAYGAQFQIENTEGRPSIKTIKTLGTQTFRSTNPAE